MKTKLFFLTLAVMLLAVPMAMADTEAPLVTEDGVFGLKVQWPETVALADAKGDCDDRGAAFLVVGGTSTGRFCDDSGTPPSSASCKTVATNRGLWVCGANQFAINKNCNPKGTPCVGPTGQPGEWCDCSYDCKTKIKCTDAKPIDQ